MFQVTSIPSKGRAIVATSPIAEGDTIFEEEPVVSAQFIYNRHFFRCCAHCQKSMEGVEEMLQRLSGRVDLPSLPVEQELFNEVYCQCAELYCSFECKDRAYKAYHCLICADVDPQAAALVSQIEECWKQFHYPPESASITLIVRCLAQFATGQLRVDQFFECFFQGFSYEVYFVVQMRENGKFEDLYHCYCMLAKYLRLEELCSEQAFVSLLNVMAINAQGVGTSSLQYYDNQMSDLLENSGDLKLESSIDRYLIQRGDLEDDIEEVSGDFTRAEGSALYALHSKLNHHCKPNAQLAFLYNNHRVQVQAIRDIAVGEEITIAYIESCHEEDGSQCLEVGEVHQQLQQFYGFSCLCDQ